MPVDRLIAVLLTDANNHCFFLWDLVNGKIYRHSNYAGCATILITRSDIRLLTSLQRLFLVIWAIAARESAAEELFTEKWHYMII